MLKKILLAVAIALPFFGASAQQSVKIGLVDTNSILQAMPETSDAQKKLAEASKKYEDEFARLQEELKRLYDEFQAMKPDELQAIKDRKTREVQDMNQKMQAFEQNAQQDLAKMQNELMQPVIQKVRTAVEAVGKEGGFGMIENYEPSLTLYYASPVVDVTPQVKAKLGLK